jgi:leucyl-tRNA synthetase
MDPRNDQELASPESINYWKDVDLYIGGAEHAVAHLMYARFWHKFLYDLKKVPTVEPFKKLINQGMIQGVIEFIYLKKGKEGEVKHFASKEIAESRTDNEWIKIPVNIEFVKDYGLSSSYFDKEGILKFINWRKEYKGNCKFETEQGIYDEFSIPEDFKLITVSEVGKMSKSKYNVINPDEVVDQYGADCFRMYEMFLGPIEQSKPWDMQGIDGVSKFLKRYVSLFFDENENLNLSTVPPTQEELKILHTAIKKVNQDIERFAFNTCVSAFMVCVNDLKKIDCNKLEILTTLNRLLAPFAPYITEELAHLIETENGSIHHTSYPLHDEGFLKEDEFEYPICFNGKKRGVHIFPSGYDKKDLESEVKKIEVFEKWTEGRTVKKIIVVPQRMINIVVTG